MKPLLSFVIPIYNCERYLARCLDSILNNSNYVHEDIEIILINDGSSDASGSICQEYADQYNFVKYFKQKNAGASEARNVGLSMAIGDYIWFVDADDYLANDIINKLLLLINQKEYDLICFNRLEEGLDGVIYPKQNEHTSGVTALEFLNSNTTLYLWDKIYKRSGIGEIRFLKGTKNIEDFMFNIEVLNKIESVLTIPEIGYVYNNLNQSSTSRNLSKRNLIKISQDSYDTHIYLYNYINKLRPKNQLITRRLLSFSIAGHIYSLIRFYNEKRVVKAINIYKSLGLIPLPMTNSSKANVLILLINYGVIGCLCKFKMILKW